MHGCGWGREGERGLPSLHAVGSLIDLQLSLSDCINVASRMESTCQSGKIQVSETTFSSVRSQYVAKPLGQQVKGIGLMATYVLEGENWMPPG
mgnify:CR=1 FL=1